MEAIMKRYTDLTMRELNELTDREVQKFIDIEVAYAGIQMVPKPLPVEPLRLAIVPTESVYSIKGVIVQDFEVAKVLQTAVIFKASYNYPDYDKVIT